MKIGIDISQMAYEKTGVGKYVKELVSNIIKIDQKNQYVLFFSSLRRKAPDFKYPIKKYPFPPLFLDLLWNWFHLAPIEWFIGDVDVFVTSDWTEPPARKAKKVTILYDLIIYRHPEETAKKIVATQKRKLRWVKKESDQILCISQATKYDAQKFLGIDEKRLKVVYPGGVC